MNTTQPQRLYTTSELGIDPVRLRAWVRRGLCKPTERAKDGSYLWDADSLIDVRAAAAYVARKERIEQDRRAIKEGRATSIDWIFDHTGNCVMVGPTIDPPPLPPLDE